MFIPGVIALWVAFAALAGSTYFYFRSARGNEQAHAWGRQLYALGTLSVVLASAVLMYLIVTHDFRLHYVFSYSDRALPTSYLISTFWAGQEGSFLLWLLWGVIIGLPLIRYARHYESRAMAVYNLTLLSLVVILLRQSPFRFLEGLPPGQVPFDGQGLNPLLQNPWMTIHPPIMFLGYAATAIPFAFAVAALWERRYDEWVRASLPWALISVVTLGCAILLGGYWAYVTLGWGGYWGWDPVENSSLVPWLASVALVHGMLLQRARGRFRKLNFSLAALGYILVVYATFLTRSGILADFSVHSFVDLGITGWLVANLAVFSVIGFGALVWRWKEIPSQVGDEPFFSRTFFFVFAIAALLAAAAVVLVGTSSPLITRLATEPSQVGPSFYNRVSLPVGILMALLLAIVPYLHWRGRGTHFASRIGIAAVLSALATAVGIALGASGTLYLVFLFVSIFAFLSNLFKTVEEMKGRHFRAAGGYLAHVGLGLMLVGIITSSAYDRTAKVVLPLNQGTEVMGYTLTFRGVDRATATARQAMLVDVTDGNGRTYTARPHLFRNEKSNQLVANPDVRAMLTRDLYISPIEYDPGRPPGRANAIELGKGDTNRLGDYAITFDGFDMSSAHGEGSKIQIGATLTVVGPTGEHQITPVLVSAQQGFDSEPVSLAKGSPVTVRLTGVNASAGRIRLEVRGAAPGIAKEASLRQGETLTYQGVALKFLGFDDQSADTGAGDLAVGARFAAAEGGDTLGNLTAVFRTANGVPSYTDAAIPGLAGSRLRLAGIDPQSRTISVAVLDPMAPTDPGEPMRFSVDFSIKPMIGLLWTGLVVLLIGGLMAVLRRGEEFRTATETHAPAS